MRRNFLHHSQPQDRRPLRKSFKVVREAEVPLGWGPRSRSTTYEVERKAALVKWGPFHKGNMPAFLSTVITRYVIPVIIVNIYSRIYHAVFDVRTGIISGKFMYAV